LASTQSSVSQAKHENHARIRTVAGKQKGCLSCSIERF
jgi:hypothetical protein